MTKNSYFSSILASALDQPLHPQASWLFPRSASPLLCGNLEFTGERRICVQGGDGFGGVIDREHRHSTTKQQHHKEDHERPGRKK